MSSCSLIDSSPLKSHVNGVSPPLLFVSQVEMKRTVSLGNLHDTMEQQEALREFYTFMDRASTGGAGGVKDAHLSVYSHALGGVLHFFHLETRFMDHAVEVIGNSPIHNNIQVCSCRLRVSRFVGLWDDRVAWTKSRRPLADSMDS